MKKPELLAPAGNMECLKAAVDNGADAVYLGGRNFSARAFAGNFDEDELAQAIRYAHLRGVRIFVTLNTLLNEFEFANALKMADFYYRSHVDALLIQDLGLYYVLKQRYPDLELHCSTQMHVHNIAGIRNARRLGFKRVVLARESSLELIKEACKQGMEIEVFVHGAICVSYSGQCLMSSFSKDRSANKGMCAQCCRMRYELFDKDMHKVDTDTQYLLSPKDMYLLEDIPELIKAGVSSFKIEGRMKSAAYVGQTVRYYRKAIDACFEGKRFIPNEEQLERLKVLFNRGFTDSHLRGKNELYGQKMPNHQGIRIGKTTGYRNGHVYIQLEKPLSQFDGIRINDFGCIVNMLYKDGLLVNKAEKGDIVSIKSDSNLNGIVYKTLDHELEQEIADTPEKRLPIDMAIELHPDRNVRVTMSCRSDVWTYESPIVAQAALKRPLDKETIIKQFSRLNETAYQLGKMDIEMEAVFLGISQLNEIRRSAIAAFDEYRLNSFNKQPILSEVELYPLADQEAGEDLIKKDDLLICGSDQYMIDPVINTCSLYSDVDRSCSCEMGGLLKDAKHKTAYYTLNCSNSYAYEFLLRLGFEKIILSTELNDQMIDELIKSYTARNGHRIFPYVLCSGNRPLMYIKADPFARFGISEGYLKGDDRLYKIHHAHGICELLEEDRTIEHHLNYPYGKFYLK